MKNKILFPIIIIFFMGLPVFSVSILTCKSGSKDWYCDPNKNCICYVSGQCSKGDLLVYKNDLSSPLCSPPIIDSKAVIEWDKCMNTLGEVKVRADCDEDQSTQKEIIVFSGYDSGEKTTTVTTPRSTTTTIPCNYVCQSVCDNDSTPPFCYNRISHGQIGCPYGTICCESILVDCPSTGDQKPKKAEEACPFDCCVDMPGYEYKYCPSGLKCCEHLCKETCEPKSDFTLLKSIIFWVIVAALVPLIAFIIFVFRRNSLVNVPEY